MRRARIAFLAFALLAAPLSLPGRNLVFILQSNATTASVYDADSLVPVAGSPVNLGVTGAFKAFGAPDFNNPGQLLKIYVVTASNVVVLNPQTLAVRATLSLPGPLSTAPNSAALTGDGRYLLVAAGAVVSVISTQDLTDNPNAITQIATLSPPAGIVVLPNSTRAYVMLTSSPVIQAIELGSTPQLNFGISISLPAIATAIGIAPNGSRFYATASTGLYEIDRVNNSPAQVATGVAVGIAFDPDAPASTAVLNGGSAALVLDLLRHTSSPFPFSVPGAAITKVVVPGSNHAMMLAGSPGRVYLGVLSAGSTSEYSNPQTGQPLGANAVDMDTSPDGRWVFVAFSDGKFVRIDPNGSVGATLVTTPSSTTTVSLVYAPLVVANLLETYGGDQQSLGSVAPPLNLPATLAVRARVGNFPVFGAVVNFSSSTGGVQNDTPVTTNLWGVAESRATLTVSTPVQVQANLASGGVATPVTFNLNGSVNNTSVLSIVSGDHQLVVQNSVFPFALVVQGTPNTLLSITADSAKVVCGMGSVTTDFTGAASILCHSLAVGSITAVQIFFTDPFSNSLPAPFHVVIVPSAADLPTQLSLQASSSLLNVPVQQAFANALQATALKANNAASPDVGVVFSSPQPVTFNPNPAVALNSAGGAATTSLTFGCSVGPGVITATLQSPNSPTATISFTTAAGPLSQLLKTQGDGQSGNAGQRLPLALVVQTSDACGNPITGQPVTWQVTAGSATLQSVVGTSDFRGNSSALVQLGNTAGAVTVTATSGSFTATFTLTVNLVASQLQVSSGNNQSVALNQQAAQPLVVSVQDANGTGVPGITVIFTVSSGTATLGAASTTTDSTGKASTTIKVGAATGSITVTASAIGKTVTFTITAVGRTPAVSTAGFVNAASFQAGWVPGSAGSIFGTGLSEVTGIVAAPQAPFPTAFQGVTVTVQGILAPIIALVNVNGQEQINIQVPFELTTPGSVTVLINNNGATATFSGVPILAVQPGIFQFTSNGIQLAAALHPNFSLITQSNPAQAGETIILFLTGMGITNPPVGTNVAGPGSTLAAAVAQAVVAINGQGAQVIGCWYAPFLYTAYQINLVIPPGTASGIATITVTAGGSTSPASNIAIR